MKLRVLDFIFGTTNIKKAKKNGMQIGENVFIGRGTFLDPSHCFLIRIGSNVTMSSHVHVLAHDASTKHYLGYTKIGLTVIEDSVFIGAKSIILPGVTIGEGSVIGAGSVVSKNVPPNQVWAGNPARYIMSVDEYLQKFIEAPRFDSRYRIHNLTDAKKQELIQSAEQGICLLK